MKVLIKCTNHEVFMCFQEVRIREIRDLWQHVTKISGWSNEKDVQLSSSSTKGGFTFFRIQIDYDVTLCSTTLPTYSPIRATSS